MTELRSGAHYVEEQFLSVALAEAHISDAMWDDCHFERCSFSGTVFERCRFVNGRFVECDFSLAKLPGCSFSSTRFERSKLIGINWALLDWSATALQEKVSWTACNLSYCSFLGLNLKGSRLVDCVAHEADLRECDLSAADLRNTDLMGCLFQRTILTRADLRGARNYAINPMENTVSRAKFDLPEALSLLECLDIDLELS